MNKIITTVLTLALTLTTLPALAQENHEAKNEREPSRGTGPLVSGILVTSIGGAVGGLFLFAGLMSSGCSSEYDDDCDSGSELMGIGAVIGGVSLGVGIPLIVSGARQRREWKSWKQQQVQEGEDRHAASTLAFGIKPMLKGGAATLTYSFD